MKEWRGKKESVFQVLDYDSPFKNKEQEPERGEFSYELE
jgi:hypothetical protein